MLQHYARPSLRPKQKSAIFLAAVFGLCGQSYGELRAFTYGALKVKSAPLDFRIFGGLNISLRPFLVFRDAPDGGNAAQKFEFARGLRSRVHYR